MKHVDQYLNKFPENEKFLGFENVSLDLEILISVFSLLIFVTQTQLYKFCFIAFLSGTKFYFGNLVTKRKII